MLRVNCFPHILSRRIHKGDSNYKCTSLLRTCTPCDTVYTPRTIVRGALTPFCCKTDMCINTTERPLHHHNPTMRPLAALQSGCLPHCNRTLLYFEPTATHRYTVGGRVLKIKSKARTHQKTRAVANHTPRAIIARRPVKHECVRVCARASARARTYNTHACIRT